jgi:hypothetical protein
MGCIVTASENGHVAGPDREAGAPAGEVEITPDMIEAGIEEYALFSSGDPGRWVVAAIYRAMEKARQNPGQGTGLSSGKATSPS